MTAARFNAAQTYGAMRGIYPDTCVVRPAIRIGTVLAAVVLVVVAWHLGSPLFIRTTANEALPTSAATASSTSGSSPAATAAGTTAPAPTSLTSVLRRGDLQYVNSLHNGTGAVLIIAVDARQFLRFEDVAITNAPDVHVYLSTERGGKWSEAQSTYLGPLKATNGSFNYELPSSIDLAAYGSVVVWCRAFAVLVTWADLDAV